MKEFAREFKRRAMDSGLDVDHAKLLLIGALNKETLSKLDTYISTAFPPADGKKEAMADRLARVGYAAIISFLK